MGCRLASYSDSVALILFPLRLEEEEGCAGALVAGGSELRVEEDPVMTLSLGSKNRAASSSCFC